MYVLLTHIDRHYFEQKCIVMSDSWMCFFIARCNIISFMRIHEEKTEIQKKVHGKDLFEGHHLFGCRPSLCHFLLFFCLLSNPSVFSNRILRHRSTFSLLSTLIWRLPPKCLQLCIRITFKRDCSKLFYYRITNIKALKISVV